MMEYLKNYPMITGAFSLWVLSVIAYAFRGIPEKIVEFLAKVSTTTMTIANFNESYYSFIAWYKYMGYANNSRYIRVYNGKHGEEDTLKSVGIGIQYFWYKGALIRLEMQERETQGYYNKESIILKKLGRSHAVFDSILREMTELAASKKNQKVKKFSDGRWTPGLEQRPRTFDTIYLNKGIKEKLLAHLERFRSGEEWYLKRGVPYQTGLLLYGPPGTGKTSIIKGISSYFNIPVYSLNCSKLRDIESAMFGLPENSLVVIEDIDTNFSVNEKRKSTEEPPVATLSDVLNAIDGVHGTHGRILIMTTNDKSKLETSLLRPGRIDLELEIGYIDSHAFNTYMSNCYDGYTQHDRQLRNDITMAQLQGVVLANRNDPQKVLDFVSIDLPPQHQSKA